MTTGVEWAHIKRPDGSIAEGVTWSVTSGCDPVSRGCKHCWAKREVSTRWSKNPRSIFFGRDFSDVQCHPDVLEQPMRWRRGRGIFVSPRSDLFHARIPDEFLDQVFAVMAMCRQHTFLIPTKRPERMLSYLANRPQRLLGWWRTNGSAMAQGMPASLLAQTAVQSDRDPREMFAFPLPNVWLGASVEDQAAADERRPPMEEIAAMGWLTWVSYEPALGYVDWAPWMRFLRWAVAGGEADPKSVPAHPDWFRAQRDQCAAAKVPFFLKQWGDWLPISEMEDGGDALYQPTRIVQANEEQDQTSEFADRRCSVDTTSIGFDGITGHYHMVDGHPAYQTFRVGKKVAGRRLDGNLHDAFPDVQPFMSHAA